MLFAVPFRSSAVVTDAKARHLARLRLRPALNQNAEVHQRYARAGHHQDNDAVRLVSREYCGSLTCADAMQEGDESFAIATVRFFSMKYFLAILWISAADTASSVLSAENSFE